MNTERRVEAGVQAPGLPDQDGVPLYEKVKHELRAEIARGQYRADEPFITQREVCDRFGVSTTTAVRALGDLVVEGVLVRRRGQGTFVRSRPGPARNSADTSAIAYVMHGQGPHCLAIISGIEAVCAELGLRMFLSDAKSSRGRQEQALRQALHTGASGVVLYPVDGPPSAAVLAELRANSLPIVMVDRYDPAFACDAVVCDNYAIGYGLTERLIEQGHRTIAVLWNETDCTSVRDRLTGHLQALRSHGLPIRPELTQLTSYQQQTASRRKEILTALLDLADPPTAVICANGFVLAAVARDLTDLGHEVPGSVELAGMDDAGPFDLLPLAGVAAELPSEEMGRRAMQILAERIAEPRASGPFHHVVLPISIHTRDEASGYLQTVRTPTR